MPVKWEIWLVNMPYEEGIGSKIRPALVIDPQHSFVLVGKMTSHSPRSSCPYEYQIIDWKKANLNRPTTLRLSKCVKLELSAFVQKVGVLQPIDQVNVRGILKLINSL